MRFSHGVTVYRLPYVAGVKDARGNVTASWGSPVPVPGCAFDPVGSQEPFQAGRDAVVSSPRIFAPVGTPWTAQDRVTVNGLVYTVQGDPLAWTELFPFAKWPGGDYVEVRLERVAG